MKQVTLFEDDAPKQENAYTAKILAPEYLPKNKQPHILELYDSLKTIRLIQEINASNISEDEKKFLIEAAKRHTVFNYNKIADYYAHASKEMQGLMERSALVIIDFNKAITLGYINLYDEIRKQFLEEYGNK